MIAAGFIIGAALICAGFLLKVHPRVSFSDLCIAGKKEYIDIKGRANFIYRTTLVFGSIIILGTAAAWILERHIIAAYTIMVAFAAYIVYISVGRLKFYSNPDRKKRMIIYLVACLPITAGFCYYFITRFILKQ